MEITIYIDADGKVTITDLPTDLLPMVNELSNNHADFCCHGIAGYAIGNIISNIK